MSVKSNGRQINLERILSLLRKEQGLTRQDIAAKLDFSMPTALQYITEMVNLGIVTEGESLESTGGRKAKILELNAKVAFAVGIDIRLSRVDFVITDLAGGVISRDSCHLEFEDRPEWYQQLEEQLTAFIRKSTIDERQILGAGISFPGIIDEEKDELVRSHIFSLEHMSFDRFRRAVPFPLVFSNDANSACACELSPELSTFFYISLNKSVGGSLMKNGGIFLGDTFQTGEVGHMLLHPGEKLCYCGKKGCADPYLSSKVLSGDDLPGFFARLEAGDESAKAIFSVYLDDLAILVTNLRMLLDIPIVLGGDVGKYLDPYLPEICERASAYDLFARDVDYLTVCRRKEDAFAAGAALLALNRYGNQLWNRNDD